MRAWLRAHASAYKEVMETTDSFALAAFGESVLRPARLTSNIGAVGAPSVCASLSVLRGQVVSMFPRLRLWPCRACECVFCFAAAVLSAAVTLRCPVSQVSIVHS